MGIRIDALGSAASAQSDHSIPAMKDGVTVKLTVGQISTFITALLVDSAPTTLDTLNELAAALGDDPNFATTVTNALAGKQPLDAMLTALAALTSANGKFLAFSGADAPAVRDIVGTVAQSGGVPTGAIVESGSNANGQYTKFADGTMICWSADLSFTNVSSASGSVFTSSSVTWTYPVAFVTSSVTPVVEANDTASLAIWSSARSINTTTAGIQLWSATSVGTSRTVRAKATGRWF